MTTIEEMVETFWEACGPHFQEGDAEKGMKAVIEKHVGPMLDEAHAAGQGSVIPGPPEGSADYAQRIIAQLKEPTQ